MTFILTFTCAGPFGSVCVLNVINLSRSCRPAASDTPALVETAWGMSFVLEMEHVGVFAKENKILSPNDDDLLGGAGQMGHPFALPGKFSAPTITLSVSNQHPFHGYVSEFLRPYRRGGRS